MAAAPEGWEETMARYNADNTDGRRIEVQGRDALLFDRDGTFLGRAPNDGALHRKLTQYTQQG